MKIQLATLVGAAVLTTTTFAQTPSSDIARGNMPVQMDANAMDTNHDGMVSKEEFTAYGEKVWAAISHGKKTVPVDTASTDFATGHMAMNVQEMDADHDGTISKDEFFAWASKAYDKKKNAQGTMTTADVTKYFGTGNKNPN